MQPEKKEEPSSSNVQLGKRQLKNWHVNSVVAKGGNLQQSFENAHWIKAGPRSDSNNIQSYTEIQDNIMYITKLAAKINLYSDITTCTRKISFCLETAIQL